MDDVGAAAADSLRFQEEIHSLMLAEPPSGDGDGGGGSSSFTALLGLPPKQAIELLHALPDPRVKPEPADSGSPSPRRPLKRKEPERTKARPNGGKKGKSGEESRGGDGEEEKLPYVHVRARRGQATDSHSLAERARREKINARMKLLQELVPGCSKISGTALVLDEIINHVQSLQKQVEFLSMRLAAVNPIFDVSGVEGFPPSDDVRLAGGGGSPALRLNGHLWGPQAAVDGARRQHHQLWQADQAAPQLSQQPLWTRDAHQYHHHGLISTPGGPALSRYDCATPPVPVNVNQMKTEL